MGSAEVLLELARIATDRGQADQAAELVESALEALGENDAEAPRLQAKLREQRRLALLLRVLDARLAHIQRPYLRAEMLGRQS